MIFPNDIEFLCAASIIVILICCAIVLQKNNTIAIKGVYVYIFLLLSFAAGNVYYILQCKTENVASAYFYFQMQYILVNLTVCLFIWFFRINLPSYNRDKNLFFIIAVLISFVYSFLIIINPNQIMFDSYKVIKVTQNIYSLQVEISVAFTVFQLLLYSFFFFYVIRVIIESIKKTISGQHSISMILSVVIPIFCNILYLLKITELDFTNILIFISAILLTNCILNYGIIDSVKYLRKNMLSIIQDPIFIINPSGLIDYANGPAEKISDKTLKEMRGKALYQINDAFPLVFTGELKDIEINNYIFKSTISSLTNKKNKVYGNLLILQNITEAINVKQRIKFLSEYDENTGLINNEKFIQTVDEYKKNRQNGLINTYIFAVSQKNADFFKIYISNDQKNQLDNHVASYIKNLIPPQFVLSKYGEEEYCIFSNGLDVDINEFCDLFENTNIKDFIVDNQIVNIEFAMGIYGISDSITTAKTATANAFYALKYAVEKFKKFAVYDFNMAREHELKKNLMPSLNNIDFKNDFYLEFQPIVDINKNIIAGAEALLRWNHPVYGQLSPAVFIPIFESTNHMEELGYAVIKMACNALIDLKNIVHENFKLSINVSKRQIDNYNFLKNLSKIIEEKQIDCKYLDFEITETATSSKLENVVEFCKFIRAMGSSISLDDFGSGDTSIAYITELGIDKIKFDISLSNSIHTNEKRRIVVKSLLDMCDKLGINVVVEHVENIDALNSFKKQGFSLIQGYVFNRPLNYKEFVNFYNSFEYCISVISHSFDSENYI